MGRMPSIPGSEHFRRAKLAAASLEGSGLFARANMPAVDRVDIGGAPCVMPRVRIVAAAAELGYGEAEVLSQREHAFQHVRVQVDHTTGRVSVGAAVCGPPGSRILDVLECGCVVVHAGGVVAGKNDLGRALDLLGERGRGLRGARSHEGFWRLELAPDLASVDVGDEARETGP